MKDYTLAHKPKSLSAHKLISLFFILLLTFLVSDAESAFTDRGGVRPMGMGGAFVALADDSSAIMFNPAGLGQIEKARVAAAYDRLYAGLGDDTLGRGFVSYIQPAQDYGAFALNLNILNAPLYKETTITFGYGKPLGSAYLGLNAKGLFASFEENDYTAMDPLFSDGMSSNGIALDLGILYKLTDSTSFGLAILNVNEPNMALDKDADADVPLTLQTGVAMRFGNTVPTIDLTYRNKKLNDDPDINLHFGLESWIADGSIALRGGINFHDMALGASYVFSRGKNIEAQLDYAFRYPLFFKDDSISDIYGTHQFSLDVRFGGLTAPRSEEVEEEDIQAEEESDQEETLESLQAAIKASPQDPRAHYKLAMLYKRNGDQTGNISWYNKAIIELERTRMIDSKYKSESVSAELAELYKKR